ncbi:hypothetical protein [Novosphingobium sp. Gsoil 351]|uniref:hypothetical protein n=1 Tax=Novosphingobium sp. Gsoil 351 TaxID=2675225 RepID=UPI0012B4E68E|nr:hypothetical protein [Novosphingobium sp. Gsoil 351]QGN54480.1 hypothetical protein GKE62_07825 [Novosphingobium sp. Gsoil 351]
MSELQLGALKGFTFVTPDIGASCDAYAAYLDYRGPRPEPVGQARAGLWGAPAAAGALMTELRPANGGERFLRLVEGDASDFVPFRSFGWAAAEIVVADLDALAQRLDGGPFRTIGPPEVLDFEFTDQIRAMQVEGPGREVLYLTEIGAEIPGFDLPRATGPVGEPFIAVLGGASLAVLGEGYGALGRPAGPVIEARIGVLSNAYDLPEATRHRLATIALPERSLIEIDAFPEAAIPRPMSSIGLPAGIAMASFAATVAGAPIAEPRLLRGAAGELIELLP